METQSELDYMISVMQAKKEGNPIMKTCKIESDFLFGYDYDMHETENFDWVRNNYFVKPEPLKPKTEKFTFSDADFLHGLTIKNKDNKWISTIQHVCYKGFFDGTGDLFPFAEYRDVVYKCPKTEEWKPFVKVIE